ncbi:MAG TPA: NAD(P)/FAD-dependent oxidoreductase [Thermomicrobiales bacterium]|nr:NAD(P)/FAD-dependent oxidoreductase [Thermomicrobiales bacterium]
MIDADVVIVGGGPGGLSAAEAAARRGAHVVLLEQHAEIGSPTRTSGGSFISDLRDLEIPSHLYHPLKRMRFIAPHETATFCYDDPVACVIDVRGLFQYLAERAISAGAKLRVSTTFLDVVHDDGKVAGVRAKDLRGQDLTVRCKVVVDATGYRAALSKKTGLAPDFQRFGVGAEYDLHAPACSQEEAVLLVGTRVAPAGYAWVFPWGRHRVRVGVGIVHADSRENPADYLHRLLDESARYGIDLTGAEPIEYHTGLIPSDGLRDAFVADGLMAVGDAAGQSSALVGEGIRWAIKAGRMAGEIAAEAIRRDDCSRAFLTTYERRWTARHGLNLFLAHEINKEITRWSDQAWDEGTRLLAGMTPEQFGQALQSDFFGGSIAQMLPSPLRFLRRDVTHVV